jgi:predicted transglutaminase-like cysteine proteinase
MLRPCLSRATDAPRRAGDSVSSYADNITGEAVQGDVPLSGRVLQPDPPAAVPDNAAATPDGTAVLGSTVVPESANAAAAPAEANAAASSAVERVPSPPATVPDNTAATPGSTAVLGSTATPESANTAAPESTGEVAGNAGAATTPAKPPVRLFGTVEFRSLIKNLPKWERVMADEEARPTFAGDEPTIDNPQLRERWKNLRAKLSDAPLIEKVRGVNNFFNQWPYKRDPEAWGVEDYWATPREFIQKSGDCEDYAVTKFYALLNLGVPKEQMRIAAVKDEIRGLGHAVLVVFMDDDAYILDNLTNLVLSHKKLTHYTPQYTVNKDYMWRHVKPKPGTGK